MQAAQKKNIRTGGQVCIPDSEHGDMDKHGQDDEQCTEASEREYGRKRPDTRRPVGIDVPYVIDGGIDEAFYEEEHIYQQSGGIKPAYQNDEQNGPGQADNSVFYACSSFEAETGNPLAICVGDQERGQECR